MKIRYVIHPGDYAIGENEKLYSDMAAKGWKLEKRGVHFSKFRKAEAEKARYRIEIGSGSEFWDGGSISDEQVAVYEECGWEFVTASGPVNVFRAPEGSDAPEFYQDPVQQAKSIRKLRRSYFFAPFTVLFVLSFYSFLGAAAGGASGGFWSAVLTETYMRWVRVPGLQLMYAAALIWGVYSIVYGIVRTALLYRHLKKGRPLDHSPSKKRFIHKSISWLLAIVAICGAVILIAQLVSYRSYEMPLEADGPYLTIADLGVEGKRAQMFGKSSKVEYTRSVIAEWWDTYECVNTHQNGTDVMYQDMLIFRSEKIAKRFLPVFMDDEDLTHGREAYRELEIPGLDEAWWSEGYIYFVRKDNVILEITSIVDFRDDEEKAAKLLEMVSELLNK